MIHLRSFGHAIGDAEAACPACSHPDDHISPIDGCDGCATTPPGPCAATALHEPDQSSPCGYEGCTVPTGKRWHVWSEAAVEDRLHHPRVPTRCLCGRSLEGHA